MDKPPIITIVDRKTKYTIFYLAKNLSKKLIHDLIKKHCPSLLKVFTDEYTIYHNLSSIVQIKNHFTVNHSKKQYADGINHVNNTENRHSILRQYLRIFRGISKKNIEKYLIINQYKINYKVDWPLEVLKTILK